ncbi:hypothetical protein WJX84_007062 [Apatococcus fuscideae]|uniref:Uncharacterized protein n=1 Tax=Apatococcus fuscideae TaxID=2026836 RepID=A0AAW1SKF8_9CHLO
MPCKVQKRQIIKARAAEASSEASRASFAARAETSGSRSGVEAEGSHALPGRAKKKKTGKHAAPKTAEQEVAESIPQPEAPSPEEIDIAKGILKKIHKLRHDAPNAEQLIAELGDPDPDDPKCVAEIVDHMRLSHAVDPVGGLPQEVEAANTQDEHAWRPVPSPFKHLFEPRYGLPIVRRYLTYGELLKEIRMEQVYEIAFFCEEKFEDEGLTFAHMRPLRPKPLVTYIIA